MPARPSILILTAGQLSRNPRVYKEALALSDAGYDVTAVRVANVPAYEAFDRSLTSNAPFRNVIINHLDGSRSERLRAFRDRAATALARRACRAGLHLPQAFGAYGSLLEAARRHPADLTIVHTEAPFCVGARLLRDGRRVAADFEDWHSEDLLPGARHSRPLPLLRRIERELLRRAAYCTAPSRALAEALGSYAGAPAPRVLRNAFPLQPTPPPRVGEPLRLFWFSQTIGPGRGLEPFVQAWARLDDPPLLSLLGSCPDSYHATLTAGMPEGIRARLTLLDPVHPHELPAVIARHDVGLALERRTPPSRDLTITNKVFQYANAGLAIWATPTSGQREFLQEAPGAGRLIDLDSGPDLVSQLAALLGDRPGIAAMRQGARAAMENRFAWEHEQANLLDAVSSALDPSCTRT